MKQPISKANYDFRSSKSSPTERLPSFGRLASRAAHMVSACGLQIETGHADLAGFEPLDQLVPDDTPTFTCMRIKRT